MDTDLSTKQSTSGSNSALPVATESNWPRHLRLGAHDIPLLFGFLADSQRLKGALVLLLGLGAYVTGIYIKIPFTHAPLSVQSNSWWFIVLLDKLLTGGAFGRASIFSLGLIAVLGSGGTPYERLNILRVGAVTGALSAVVAMIFLARGVVTADVKHLLSIFMVLYAGGVALTIINRALVRHHGPDMLHVNVIIILAEQVRSAITAINAGHSTMRLLYVGTGIAVVLATGYFVVRKRVSIEVQHIKYRGERRFSKLQLASVDEATLDLVGVTCLMFYLAIAGIVSLLLNWRSVASQSQYWSLTFISVLSIALMWLIVAAVRSVLRHIRGTGVAKVLGIHDPSDYARRLINNFWIIPNVEAGMETEDLIARKTRRGLNTLFLSLIALLAAESLIQYRLLKHVPHSVLFPYGPIVPFLLIYMIGGNLSMIGQYLWARLSHFKQLLKGKTRLRGQTFPLGAPDQIKYVGVQADPSSEYWHGEEIIDQLRDLADWVALLRQSQALPDQTKIPRRVQILSTALRIMAIIVFAASISFLGGLVLVLAVPEATAEARWSVIISLFVPLVLAENILWRIARRPAKEVRPG